MANSTVNIYGYTKGGAEVFNTPTGGEQQGVFNNRGDLLVANSLTERAELVRLGNSWGACIKDANQFTLLITIPTTLADLSLQNGEASNGKSYIIERVWITAKTSLAAANYLTIMAQLVPSGTALVADSANKLVWSLSGRASYTGKAQIALASTATGCIADRWFRLGGLSLPTSTTIGAAYDVPCFGRYVVPPGASFNLTAQEAVSGGAATLGIEWHEVQLACNGG